MEKNLQGIIESVLFAAGEAVRTDKLAQILEVDEQTVQYQIGALTALYN